MEIKVFNSSSKEDYSRLLQTLPEVADIYYLPGFLESETLITSGKWEVFTVVNDKAFFIYPYILKELPGKGEVYDITSPYGYSGPWTNNLELLVDAEVHLIAYLKSRNVITEFVRYHYQYNRDLKFSVNIENTFNRQIAVADLGLDYETHWKEQFSSTNRNLVTKLKKEGYVYEELPFSNFDSFRLMYEETMKKAGADSFYFFPAEYYESLAVNLGQNLFHAKVSREGEIFSQALFFTSGKFLTYFLSARNVLYPKVPATNLLLSSVILNRSGMTGHLFNLGGGRSTDKNDGLLQFKLNFTRNTEEFFIGKRIFDQDTYFGLQKDFIAVKGSEAYEKVKGNLQFYRQ